MLTRNDIQFYFAIGIVLASYTFGNFGFFNVFNIKYELYYILLIALSIISFFLFIINFKKMINEPFVLLFFYLFICSFFVDNYHLNFTIKALVLMLFSGALLALEIKYIDLIAKCMIVISFLFSILGILLFLYYQFHPELLIDLGRVFHSYEKFIDLSNIPLHQKFGFVIEIPEKNFLGLEYIRSRSFVSEPSATIPLFFTIGILSFLYKGIFRLLGCVILFFSIVLIYAGSSVLSLFTSVFFLIGLFFFKKNSSISSMVILFSVICIFGFIYTVDLTLFDGFIPEAKVTSFPSGVLPITQELNNVLSNPFYNSAYDSNSFIGLGLMYLGAIPVIGLALLIRIFYSMFRSIILISTEYKVFSVLVAGLIIQAIIFSSGGWLTISGNTVLILIWMKLNKYSQESSKVAV